MKAVQSIPDNKKGKILFISVFLWTLVTGLLVQKVILIYVFPQLNAGHGLMAGSDYLEFHQIAVEWAEKIHTQGWSAWELTPKGQAVSGIAAIFYAIFTPQPWVLLPWNALLHALAALFLFKTFCLILDKKEWAFLAALPLSFFPSAFTWTIMMHNENYIVIGATAAIYSFVKFLKSGTTTSIKEILLFCALNLLALVFILIVRPDAAQALAILFLGMLVVYMIRSIIILVRCKVHIHPKQFLSLFFGFFILTATQVSIIREFNFFPQEKLVELDNSNVSATTESWKKSRWIPSAIDNKIYQMARMRNSQLQNFPHGATNIDENVSFFSAMDVIAYLPRAAQIGFLSPFPNLWFTKGFRVSSQMERLVSALEMIISYVALLCMPVVIWRYRKSFPFWAYLLINMAMVLIYAIGMPNVGTLYRFRYPFYTPLVGLGLSGISILASYKT